MPVAQVSTVDSPERPTNGKAKPEEKTPRFVPRMIRLSDIDRDEDQPRATPRSEENQASLVESIRRDGFFSVLTVRPGEGGRFTLITGEGRLVAAEMCGYEEVLCLVCESPLTEPEIRRMQFDENMRRESLNPVDQGALFKSLMRKHRMTQTQVGKLLDVGQSTVSEYVQLLKIPDDLRDRVARGKLGVHAALNMAKRRTLSTVDTEAPKPETEPSPFQGDDPFQGVTLHANQSWVDKATGLMFAIGRRSKRAVTDKELLRALKARVAELEARLAPPTPNP
jgi:ParB/RepB/Spo0J family partition protein